MLCLWRCKITSIGYAYLPFEWSAVFYVTNQYLMILNPFLIISAYLKSHKRVGSKVHLGFAQPCFVCNCLCLQCGEDECVHRFTVQLAQFILSTPLDRSNQYPVKLHSTQKVLNKKNFIADFPEKTVLYNC